MRLFLAINLPKELRADLFQIGQGFEDIGKMKAVEEENIHLTLKFLGEAEPGQIIDYIKNIKFEPFEVSLQGLGAFPDKEYVKVLWAGVKKGFEETVSLNETIEKLLPGFKEEKEFHPHATIGRVKFVRDKKALGEFFEENDKEFGSFKVNSFDLMKSELMFGGPEYEIVKTFTL